MSLSTLDTEQHQRRKLFLRNCLTDSGFVCRHLLGWNYDEDPKTNKKINIGSGGVRNHGPHKKMVDFLDSPGSQFKLLMAPRGSYKSTILQGFVIRQILRNPNVRILYGMKTDKQVLRKARAIRSALLKKEIQVIFGPQRGDPWEKDQFNVAGRTQHELQETTFQVFSLEREVTGGHFDFIIFDDPIDWENCKTADALENSKKVLRLVDPLLTTGGTLILCGTRYADDDLYSEPLKNPEWAKLIFDAGVEPIETSKGLDLKADDEGTTFPHQTLDYLRGKLRRMGFVDFCAQYLNKIVSGMVEPFRRDHFQPITLTDPQIRNLSGYLLTDTATAANDDGCYSVVAYCGLDEQRFCYLLDLRVGFWTPDRFVDEFMDVLQTWRMRCNHRAEVLEKISANVVFQVPLMEAARVRGLKLNFVLTGRGTGDPSKNQRIASLQTRLQNRQFFVNSTVPRSFMGSSGPELLFDPEGYFDHETKEFLPGGELVEQFLRFMRTKKKDIPDAIADIDAVDRRTMRRLCTWQRPSNLTEGVLQSSSAYTYPSWAQGAPSGAVTDWWTNTINQWLSGSWRT